MKVMQIVEALGTIGGTEMYVRRLSEQLCRQGHDTMIVTGSVPSEAPAYRVVQTSDFISASGEGSGHILRLAEEYRPDIVLSHTTFNGGLLMALNARRPTVELAHVFLCAGGKLFRNRDMLCTHPVGARCLLDWYSGPCGPQKSPLLALRMHQRTLHYRDALRRLPAVLVLTDFMRNYLIGDGLKPERVHVVESNLGIPPEVAMPVQRPSRPGASLLFVGRVVYNKGVQYAVEALTKLEDSYRLTVVGDGFYLSTLKALAARLGVQDRVEFAGFLQGEALEERYRAADIALVPSLWPEPAGLVVPESRGRGLPVVAFDVGGLREWSARYGYGGVYLAAPASADALARAIADAAGARPPAPLGITVTPGVPVAQALESVLAAPMIVGSA